MSALSRSPRFTHRVKNFLLLGFAAAVPDDCGGSAAVSEHSAACKPIHMIVDGASGNSCEAARIDCKTPANSKIARARLLLSGTYIEVVLTEFSVILARATRPST